MSMSAGAIDWRQDRGTQRQRGEHTRSDVEARRPSDPTRQPDQQASRAQHAHPVQGDANGVGHAQLARGRGLNRVCVDRDVLRCREHDDAGEDNPENRIQTSCREGSQRKAQAGQAEQAGCDPLPSAAVPVYQRGPKPLETPGQTELGQVPDLHQARPAAAQIDRDCFVDQTKGKPGSKGERGYPGKTTMQWRSES